MPKQKVLKVAPHIVIELLRYYSNQRNAFTMKIAGMPHDAEFVSVSLDKFTNYIVLRVASSTFPDVPDPENHSLIVTFQDIPEVKQ